ncbi:MAG: VCBS repeat-containing protein [Nocardioides sp.]
MRPTSAFAGRDLIAAVGDLDGNGANDLVARNPRRGTLVAYWGKRAGGFKRASLTGGVGSADLLTGAGDLTGDGHPDVLVRDGGVLRVYPGTGRRALGAARVLSGDFSRYGVVRGLGDYTGDGADDLFVRETGTGDSWILPSNGDGTFGHRLGPFTGQRTLQDLSAAQLAGNAAPDLVGVRRGRLVLLRNAGTVNLGRPIATGLSLRNADLVLNAGDWDRDGHGDIIARSARTGVLRLRLGDGKGHFGNGIKIGAGFESVDLLAAVGDMTGDGWPDLMGQPRGRAMRIYPGNGTAGLRSSYVAYSGIAAAQQVGVGRWNADGSPDTMVRSGRTLRLYPGNGPGGLTSPAQTLDVNVGSYDWVVGVSDLGMTGHADVIVRGRKTGFLFVLKGTDSGFAPRRLLGEGMGVYDLAG